MMATKKALKFNVGDWIVHYYIGVGEVIEIVEKVLEGKQQTFLRVSTADIEYWLPSDKVDVDHIKPIRTKKEFENAIQIISSPPEPILESQNKLKRLIYERWLDGSLQARAALLRDLNGRKHVRELSFDEKLTFEKIEKFFISEWIISNPTLTKSTATERLSEAFEMSIQSAMIGS
jgi:RNA polymerase-interacting CarD/CdnL/TRCF family regulator